MVAFMGAHIIAPMATTLPRNADVADQLDLLADLSEIRGDDSFRVSAYRRAATRVRETSASVAELALAGRAKELQGIGKTIEEKVVEIVQDGEIHALTRRKAEIPDEVVLFMRLPGLGPKSAKKIWKELGVTTLEELRQAAETQRLRTLAGMGSKTEENVLRALAEPVAAEEPKRTLLGRALPALKAVVSVLAEHPSSDQVSIAGSARRYKETVRDLDIIATANDPLALIDYFTSLRWVVEVAAKGPTKATVVSQEGYRFDLRVVPPECYGNLLQHFTGSKDHNVALREAAVRRNLSVSEYGVQNTETEETFTARTEDELYRFLGYDFIPPELRENSGELEAARNGELPQLVELRDLRGDLHTHTHWSADGKNTLEEMVRAAIARGYDYYAITDHSHYLREGRLEAQAKEIAALQEEVEPFRILRGVEVNIKADGTLDLLDEQLATLDWVVASVHAARLKSPLERVFAAMENPYVDCIGHLTGRKLNKRGPVGIDVERVIEKALETKTFLEMNSQPDRLDLRDAHARAAREAGLKLVVNSDGHELGAQDYVEFGIGQARRAWLTKTDVVNTRTWKQIERIRKRRPST
jgi:DNA polymerase (family X)